MADFGYIKDNLEELCSEIRSLEEKYNRPITLVAVTKSGTDEELAALVRAGAADIGENRPGELKRRGELLRSLGLTPRLHEIGNLQRNKVKLVIDRATLIHSVGKRELADEISRQASALGIRVEALMEVNCANEEAKGGVSFEEAEALFLYMRSLPALSVRGIMTMGPPSEDPEELRPYFKKTHELFRRLEEKYGYDGVGILSMGMSDSYRVAIEEGATLVRVGRRLFRKNTKGDIENV